MAKTAKLIYKGALYKLAKGIPSAFQEAYDNQVVKPRENTTVARCIQNVQPIHESIREAKKRIDLAFKDFAADKTNIENDVFRFKIESFFRKAVADVTNTEKTIEDFANELATVLMSLKKEEKTKVEKAASTRGR